MISSNTQYTERFRCASFHDVEGVLWQQILGRKIGTKKVSPPNAGNVDAGPNPPSAQNFCRSLCNGKSSILDASLSYEPRGDNDEKT